MRKSTKILIAVTGILLILVGIFCIAKPGAALVSMAWLIGLITLVSGIVQLVAVLNAQRFIPNSGTRVLSAIFQIILGCLLLGHNLFVTISLPVIFCVWVMVEGVITAVKAFDYKQVEYKWWWCILILGICAAVLGGLGLKNLDVASVTLSVLVGIAVIVNGVSYLVTLGGINRFEKRVKEGLGKLIDRE